MGAFWEAAALMLALVTPQPIDTTPTTDSGLRVHGGAAAWLSEHEDEAERRVLVVRDRGRTRALEAIESWPWTSFDLGTDSRGRVVLVYALCENPGDAVCELRRVRPDGSGDRRLPVRGSQPTLSRGRLTYARRDGVVERPLDAPASHASRRVAPMRGVGWLEAAGPWLVSVTVDSADEGVDGIRRLRLHDTRTGRTREIARVTVGLGGQAYTGPSFAGDHLGWAFTAHGDAAGCARKCGVWRYDLRTGATERAEGPSTVGGFALAGGDRATITNRGRVRFLPAQPFAPAAP